MDVFTMVVIIVVVTTIAGVYEKQQKNKYKAANANQDDLLAEIDELRERVEVLEKIVTDEKYQLHREIDALEKSA